MISNFVGDEYNNSDDIDKTLWEVKYHEANRAVEKLQITQDDIVYDVGSGPGMICNYVSQNCNKLYCVDISKSFLKYAMKNNENNKNVGFFKIKHGVFNHVPKPNKIYCLATFIHFNLYDIHYYLKSFYDKIDNGGMVFFDILSDEYLNLESDEYKENFKKYQKNPKRIYHDMKYHNPKIIEKVIHNTGFSVVETFDDYNHKFWVLKK